MPAAGPMSYPANPNSVHPPEQLASPERAAWRGSRPDVAHLRQIVAAHVMI
jgi:hypothetical protein